MKRQLESLFLFLVVGQLSMGRNGFSSEICGKNPVPGLLAMKRGYDITTYTFHEHQEPANMKEDIFEYTCNLNLSSTLLETKFTYPDQFDRPERVSNSHQNRDLNFIDHFEQFIKTQRNRTKTDDMGEFFEELSKKTVKGKPELEKIGEALGAISKLAIPPQKSTLVEYSSIVRNTELHAWINLFELRSHILKFKNRESTEQWTLRDDFKKAYNALPDSFLNNQEPFLSFISRFGTHFMNKALFGGQVKYRIKYIYKGNDDDRSNIEYKVKEFFDGIVFPENNYYNPTGEDTRNYVEIRTEIIGGNVSIPVLPSNPQNLEAWRDSLFKNGTIKLNPIQVSFVPIARLIANESISFQVAQAIVYKVKRETLERYNELMKIIEPKHYYPSATTLNLKQLGLKKEYEFQYNEVKELLNIPTDKNPRHLVDIITKNTNELESKVNSLINIFENSFDDYKK